MLVNIGEHLLQTAKENHIDLCGIQLPDIAIETDSIHAIMINEVPPQNPGDSFYSKDEEPDYMKTTLNLFHSAVVDVRNINDILNRGIYITTAVKVPKQEYEVPKELISDHLPLLEKELDLLPNLKVIMLMGDVAKKALNMIAKKRTKKNTIPTGSTYKLRNNEFYFDGCRVFPSYIMTGGNILIEKSKCTMISEDIQSMMDLIG